MSKKNTIIIAVITVLLIVAGVVAYFLMQQQSNSADKANNNGTSNQEQNSGGMIGEVSATLDSLFNGSANRVCTYSDEETNGTVYVAGDNNLRVDYTSTHPEQPDGSMIMTKENVYVWTANEKEGFIMPTYDDEDGNASSGEYDFGDEDVIDSNKDYKLNCQNWSVERSRFTPPSDVNFTDMGAMMRDLQ